MIHYVQPYDKNSPPNIGGAINKAICQLNTADEDWVCLMDHDMLWLRSDSKKQLEEILEVTDFQLLGPLTNRLSAFTQLYHGQFNDDSDIRNHIKIADDFHNGNYGMIKQIKDPIAAFCMCFTVKVWKHLGGFSENNLQFDWLFSERALRSGMKVGLLFGIYVWHSYRLNSDNPRKDIQHLL